MTDNEKARRFALELWIKRPCDDTSLYPTIVVEAENEDGVYALATELRDALKNCYSYTVTEIQS